MAQKIIITDDLDGSPDAKTVTFAIEGTTYEIDLTDKNLAKLHGALDPFTEVARKVGSPRGAKASKPKRELGPVRTWAAANGYELNPRGRVPKAVLDAYDEAH